MPHENVNSTDGYSSPKPWNAPGEIADEFYSWIRQSGGALQTSTLLTPVEKWFHRSQWKLWVRSTRGSAVNLDSDADPDTVSWMWSSAYKRCTHNFILPRVMSQCLVSRIHSHFGRRKQHTQWCGPDDALTIWTTTAVVLSYFNIIW